MDVKEIVYTFTPPYVDTISLPAMRLSFASCLPLLVAAVCTTSGCELISPDDPASIQPLGTGYTWTYVDSIFGATVSTGTLTISVPGTTTIFPEGEPREVFRWQVSSGNTLLRTNLIDVEDGDLWHFGQVDGPDTLLLRTLWAPYPVSTGDTFQEQRFAYDAATGTYALTGVWTWTCVSTDEPIVVDGGRTLRGVVFEARPAPGTEHRIYYALDVGYAGWQTRQDGQVVFRERLHSYRLD